ncbi:MAG: APC family permease, partial [Clostridiaceae bacterium]|nr:APC family permease [Clostridiaceae bacterium]
PMTFGKKNNRGSRIYILTFMYIASLIPIIGGLSITVITNMVQLIMAALAFLYMAAYLRLPKKYPEEWKKARLHVPNGLYYTICYVSLAFFIVMFLKACLSMSPALAIANVIAIVVMAVLGLWRAKTGEITIHTSVWTED